MGLLPWNSGLFLLSLAPMQHVIVMMSHCWSSVTSSEMFALSQKSQGSCSWVQEDVHFLQPPVEAKPLVWRKVCMYLLRLGFMLSSCEMKPGNASRSGNSLGQFLKIASFRTSWMPSTCNLGMLFGLWACEWNRVWLDWDCFDDYLS